MAKRGDPGDLAVTVTLLRALRGWTKKQLADASGVDKSQISRYELGRETPSSRTLERLAAGAGLPPSLLAPMTAFLHRLREAMAGQASSETAPADPAGLTPETKKAVLEALDRAASQARAELKLHAGSRSALPGTSGSEPVT
jgi:transcriptional regulator with XRE-family HTH domain